MMELYEVEWQPQTTFKKNNNEILIAWNEWQKLMLKNLNDIVAIKKNWPTYRVSHQTWQLVNNLKCLLPYFVTKENNKNYMAVLI